MSIEKELEFNVLNRISLLYSQKTDNTGLLGLESMYNTLTPTQKRHMCSAYCYNDTRYEFCNFCPDESKLRSNPNNVSSNPEPGFFSQFQKLSPNAQSNNTHTDNVIYNQNDIVPYNSSEQTPIKEVQINNMKYKLYAPYIILKGEEPVNEDNN